VGISALIITKNEEKRYLRECLTGLTWADEVLVVDSGSSDRTIEIARQYGARVLHHPWAGFGAQKNWGIERCRHEWVLSVDADEVVTPELVVEIRQAVSDPQAPDGFYLGISTYLGDARIRCFEGLQLIRLFRRDKGRYNNPKTDETVEVKGNKGKLRTKLQHHGFSGYSEYISKFNYYTTLEARKIDQVRIHNNPVSLGLVSLLEGIKVFIKYYFLRLGLLDGPLGLFVAVFSMLYPMISFFKAWEIAKRWLTE
jgi:glycosyltransferase involved in cell wall biosynthesis